jgi:hypothetical protein
LSDALLLFSLETVKEINVTAKGFCAPVLLASAKFLAEELNVFTVVLTTEPDAPALPVVEIFPSSIYVPLTNCAARSVAMSVTPLVATSGKDNSTLADAAGETSAPTFQ